MSQSRGKRGCKQESAADGECRTRGGCQSGDTGSEGETPVR